jgi:hypothetical protein
MGTDSTLIMVTLTGIQWYLGLRVTWPASVLQDKQKFLINFNLINERCLAILYYLYASSAECHVITSRSGLLVIVSHNRSQSAYLIRIVNIRASDVITWVCVKHFLCDCSLLTVLRQWPQWRKEKEMITVEVKNGSASWATARGYGDLVWGGEKDGDIPLLKWD